MASAYKPLDSGWKTMARASFLTHTGAVIGIIGTLFYMLLNHMFEYHYVWQHSNTEMPMRYIFSCFWEGQEGSFLLWSFWHVVLGLVLMRTSKEWEAPVMTTVSLVQAFLGSMLLGIYAFDIKIGSNPFTILLREHPDFANLPLFTGYKLNEAGVKVNNYLSQLDGRGLNPLLQNYWMTIHPPTLFLGFASTLVPFAYAIGGLWMKKPGEWQKPALPWAFFAIMILGTGILMGGAWAYEALSFGGFWAWDPVENASLVPWLTLVGATHVMLIYKSRKISLYSSIFLTLITFILILYSTFLTRSGILGTTSVHAFTDLGMSGQLLLYLLFFVWLSASLLIADRWTRLFYNSFSLICFALFFIPGYKSTVLLFFGVVTFIVMVRDYIKSFPKETEEPLWSREFWMLVGSLVFMLSSIHIILFTSLPVINKFLRIDFIHQFFAWLHSVWDNETVLKMAEARLAPDGDIVQFYNNWQVWFALAVCLLIAVSQFFKYSKTNMADFRKRIFLSFAIASGITAFIAYPLFLRGMGMLNTGEIIFRIGCTLLLFSSIFAVAANFDYFVRVLKGKVRNAGGAIAHAGFGLLILGALISTSQKNIISASERDLTQRLGQGVNNNENVMLEMGDTTRLGEYYAVYKDKRFEGINVYFEVDYFRKNGNKLEHAFTLNPRMQLNPRMGNVPEPDTRHYLHKDIYTHITFIDKRFLERNQHEEDPGYTTKTLVIRQGEESVLSTCIVNFDSLTLNIDRKKHNLHDSLLAVGAHLTVTSVNNKKYSALPIFVVKDNHVEPIEARIPELGLKFVFWKINPETAQIEITVSEKKVEKEYIVMQAIVFPGINVLWLGCIIMIFGTVLAILQKLRRKPNT
jgi:cytochrome c-type biogenesis protein CcmF